MRLYIIRHGETVWNTQGRLQGKADVDLNENGVRLAEVTAGRMKDIPLDLCITSPLIRAKRTVQIVLGDRKIPICEDTRIQEITFGSWEGLCCRKENYQIPSPEFSKFFSDPFAYQPAEDGESIRQLLDRTGEFLEEILHKREYEDKNILLATHGCASRALLYHLGDTKDLWRGKVPPNCSVSIVDSKNGVPKLVELDKIYYDPEDIVDFYR